MKDKNLPGKFYKRNFINTEKFSDAKLRLGAQIGRCGLFGYPEQVENAV